VRELRTPGSVRGVLGNGHPYRDRAPLRDIRPRLEIDGGSDLGL